MADVVIFYGLPFSGKSAYCEENFSTYKRVSAQEIYRNDPSTSLRQIILQIITHLRSGHKVVIDDENWSDITRASYINSIHTKIPDCTFECVTFEPHNKMRVYWAREWALAEQCLATAPVNPSRVIDMCQSDGKFERWFRDGEGTSKRHFLKPPCESEGFTITQVKTHLQAKVFYKFEVPALFIQWQSIVKSEDETLSVVTGVKDTLSKWYQINPCGRIIIIIGRQNDCDEENSQLKDILLELCDDFRDCPVYFCGIEDEMTCGQFALPPQPGLIAWLQRLHGIQLNHRGTLYLVATAAHIKSAEAAGVSHMIASTVYAHPGIVTAPNCATKGHEPSLHRNVKLRLPTGCTAGEPRVPLQDEVTVENFLRISCPGSRFHGVCFKDINVFKKYQELYVEHATLLTEKVSKIDQLRQQRLRENTAQAVTKNPSRTTDRSLPQWLLGKCPRDPKPVCSHSEATAEAAGKRKTSPNKQTSKHKMSRSLSRSTTVYCMNELELVETAKMVLKEIGYRNQDLVKSETAKNVVSPEKMQKLNMETNADSRLIVDRPILSDASTEEDCEVHSDEERPLSDGLSVDSENERQRGKQPGERGRSASPKSDGQVGIPHNQGDMETDAVAVDYSDSVDSTTEAADVPITPSTTQTKTTDKAEKKKVTPGLDLTFLDDIF